MTYRDWVVGDALFLSEIEEKCFKSPWSEAMILSSMKLKNFFGRICEDNDRIVGYIGSVSDDWDGEILNVAVIEDYRRRGIAKKLMNEVISRFTYLGKEKIFLEVRITNEPAKNLYFSLGFKPVGIRKKYYENTEDAIVMAKLLKGV